MRTIRKMALNKTKSKNDMRQNYTNVQLEEILDIHWLQTNKLIQKKNPKNQTFYLLLGEHVESKIFV